MTRRPRLVALVVAIAGCAYSPQSLSGASIAPFTLLGILDQPTVKTVARVTERPIGHPIAVSTSGAVCALAGPIASKWWTLAPGAKLRCAWR